MKRMLALVLSLMLLIPALAEDTEQGVQNDVVLEELDIPEGDASDDVELDLELDGAIEPSLDLSEGELIEVPEIGDLVDEASTVNAGAAEEGALADNAGETAKVRYIDARGKDQGEKTCNVLKSGNENRNMGDGWYAVTGNISYSAGIIVFGKANLILCDGATLTDTDGIWVQEKASLTIWAQSTGKKMGKLVAHGGKRKAGIGGIEDEVAGPIVINGGDIEAKGGEEGTGIGSGYGKKSGYTRIEINGGKVTATGYNESSGIGKAEKNKRIGDVIITGGVVRAYGGRPGVNGYTGTGAIEGNNVISANASTNQTSPG